MCVCLRLHALTLRATLSNKPINKLYSSKIFHICIYFLYFVALFANSVVLGPFFHHSLHTLSLSLSPSLSRSVCACALSLLPHSLPFLLLHSLSRCLTLIPIFILSIVRVSLFFVIVPCQCVRVNTMCIIFFMFLFKSHPSRTHISVFIYRCQSQLHGRQSRCLSFGPSILHT